MLTFRNILPGENIAREAAQMIQKHSWGLDYPVDAWSELKQSDFIVGCFDGEKLVGLGSITRVSSPDKIDNGLPWLASALVLPDYRGRGIYGRLYDRRMSHLKDANEPVAFTCTDNPLVEKFLAKRGWSLRRVTKDESGCECRVFYFASTSQIQPRHIV